MLLIRVMLCRTARKYQKKEKLCEGSEDSEGACEDKDKVSKENAVNEPADGVKESSESQRSRDRS